MSGTDFSHIKFSEGPVWTEEDERIYRASGISPMNRYSDLGGWEQLSNQEKAISVSYLRAINKALPVSRKLIEAINEIHEKFPDFHTDCIPYTSPIKVM